MKTEFHETLYILWNPIWNVLTTRQPVPERVGIYSTEDEKLQALGEVLVSVPGRAILKVLFEGTLTANEIAVRTGYSLQLVRYHLKKMQDVNLVEISKIGKNTKSHDMKYYSATKFAIVIVPSRFSERTRASKSLARSFKSIYRLGSVGVAAVGAWFAASVLQGAWIAPVGDQLQKIPPGEGSTSYNPFYNGVGGPYSGDGGIGSGATLEEMLKLARERVTSAMASPHAGSGTPFFSAGHTPEFFWPMVAALAVVAAGISMEIIMRLVKVKNVKPAV
ncbi:MAG TPA: winged helix-turn-helix domain-containing protein [Candidatus Nitrosotalea sp.]|nr:winged helix-turn-helix domain-containing protein [Candidatus Nitrosotalea sp.]